MREYHKLVRDRIPEIIAAKGAQAVFRELTEQEYASALFNKLLEEANEAVAAQGNAAELAKELADLSEVIHALSAMTGIAPEAIESARIKRNEERGGFEKRLMLESTE